MAGSTRAFLTTFRPGQRAFLTSEPMRRLVPDDIRRQNRRQSPFYPLAAQVCSHNRSISIVYIKAQGLLPG